MARKGMQNGSARRNGRGKGAAAKAVTRANRRGGSRRRTMTAAAVRELEGPQLTPTQMNAMRDLFWCNVVRDMLNGLAVLGEQQPQMLDGRVGLLLKRGPRIPVVGVVPMFACSIPGSAPERDASAAVQCTIFQITTPEGEVFTLPVHEIRGLHTMTQELLEKLQQLTDEEGEEQQPRPFGLAAFAALPKPKGTLDMSEGLGE